MCKGVACTFPAFNGEFAMWICLPNVTALFIIVRLHFTSASKCELLLEQCCRPCQFKKWNILRFPKIVTLELRILTKSCTWCDMQFFFILNTVGVLRGQLPTEHSHCTNQSSSSCQLMRFGSFGQIWWAHSHALDWGASLNTNWNVSRTTLLQR